MKIGFNNAPFFSGSGVHKAEWFAWRRGYDSHVADYAISAVGAGKKDEIAQFSLL